MASHHVYPDRGRKRLWNVGFIAFAADRRRGVVLTIILENYAMHMRNAVLIVGMLIGSTTAKAQLVRRGLIYTTPRDSAHRSGKLAATLATPDASLFSLGTLFGVSHFTDNPSTYKIVNNVVQFDDERGHWQPGAYVLPSINLVGTPGRSISAIVPANLNTSGQSSVGVGLTIGFNLNSKHTAEVGVAGAAIWSDITRLTAQQQTSFNQGTPLPAGAATDFRSAKKPSFAFGIYILPLL